MTGREKLERALAHQAGPVPLDLGATSVTGIHCSVVEGLRKYYGLDPHPVPISDPYQMLGILEDDLLNAMGIDTGCIFNDATILDSLSAQTKSGSRRGDRLCWSQKNFRQPSAQTDRS